MQRIGALRGVPARKGAQIELGYLGGVKKPTANDLLDMSRIVVAFNDAGVLLCDTAMSEVIKRSNPHFS